MSPGRAALCVALLAAIAPLRAARGDAAGALELVNARLLRTPTIDGPGPCLPPTATGDRAASVRAVRTPGDARDLLAVPRPSATPDDGLVVAVLSARAAGSAAELREARLGLAPFRDSAASERVRLCARLETARLELLARHYPEAAAHARVARRLLAKRAGLAKLGEVADFYRAEALHLAGRTELARVSFRLLATALDERIALAARLRSADALFESGERVDARIEYESLLPRARDFGASLWGWGLRASESAKAAGDPGSAVRWLERILDDEPPEDVAALAGLRLGELLLEAGQVSEGEKRLRAVHERDPDGLVGLAAWLLLKERSLGALEDEDFERLRALRALPPSALAGYARLLLARALLARGDPLAAVHELLRVSRDQAADAFADHAQKSLDRALTSLTAEVSGPDACVILIDRLGWLRSALVRHAQQLDPFLRLGSCYEELALPDSAVELYRLLGARFGARERERLVLPLARVSLALGEVERVRRAALPRVRMPGVDQDEWRLLLAETEILDGRYAVPAEDLRELVGRQAPLGSRVRAIAALAHAAARVPNTADYRDTLGAAVSALEPAQRQRQPERVGHAALVAAEGYRIAGEIGRARGYYALARELLPPGQRRSEAAYWWGALAEGSAALPAIESALEQTEAGAWRALAESQLELEQLRERARRPLEIREDAK